MTREPEASPAPRERRGFWFCALASTSIFVATNGLFQAANDTAHLEGLWLGLLTAAFVAPFFLVLFQLPWTGSVFLLYRWCRWCRHRTAWSLVPGVACLVVTLVSLLSAPPTTAARFERLVGTPIPPGAKDIHSRYRTGGFDGIKYDIYFETSPDQIPLLLKTLRVPKTCQEKKPADLLPGQQRTLPEIPGAPSILDWSVWFEHQSTQSQHFNTLYTDPTRTKVFITIHGY